MSKTNFTKVEESLDEGLRKIKAEQWLQEATQASQAKKQSSSIPPSSNLENPAEDIQAKEKLLKGLKRDFSKLSKEDKAFYKRLRISKKVMQNYFDNIKTLTPDEWETIKQIRKKTDEYIQYIQRIIPKTSDSEIVEKERSKHINKRFKVKESWLPLK